jgi:hypothetical protein
MLVGIVMLLLAFASFQGGKPGSDGGYGIMFGLIGAGYIIGPWFGNADNRRYNREQLATDQARWARSFLCMRCGHRFEWTN